MILLVLLIKPAKTQIQFCPHNLRDKVLLQTNTWYAATSMIRNLTRWSMFNYYNTGQRNTIGVVYLQQFQDIKTVYNNHPKEALYSWMDSEVEAYHYRFIEYMQSPENFTRKEYSNLLLIFEHYINTLILLSDNINFKKRVSCPWEIPKWMIQS